MTEGSNRNGGWGTSGLTVAGLTEGTAGTLGAGSGIEAGSAGTTGEEGAGVAGTTKGTTWLGTRSGVATGSAGTGSVSDSWTGGATTKETTGSVALLTGSTASTDDSDACSCVVGCMKQVRTNSERNKSNKKQRTPSYMPFRI